VGQFFVTYVAVVIGRVVIAVFIGMVFVVALDEFHLFSKLIDHGS
jgi:hypothetical protein